MNVVGIDVAKGKSVAAIIRPFGEVVVEPFSFNHDYEGLKALADQIKSIPGETKVVMEYTSKYYRPVALFLKEQGIFVCVLNALLVHNYRNDSIRKGKTDKMDSVKLANYGIEHWLTLVEFVPEAKERELLKMFNRQLDCYEKTHVAWQNNLLSLLDQTFPGIRNLFWYSGKTNGHDKWIDFAKIFWHAKCVTRSTLKGFIRKYRSWCEKAGYYFNENKAEEIYAHAKACVPCIEQSPEIQSLVTMAVDQLNAVREAIEKIHKQMEALASGLPEYDVLIDFYGIGVRLASQILAETGDVSRFYKKGALVAYAGLDSPPDQSGSYNAAHRRITKRGSPLLRSALFQAMRVLLIKKPEDNPIYDFMQKKRQEGKPYKVYVMAGASKFLRILYARVMEKRKKEMRCPEPPQSPSPSPL